MRNIIVRCVLSLRGLEASVAVRIAGARTQPLDRSVTVIALELSTCGIIRFYLYLLVRQSMLYILDI